jgi:hypothetical protein
MALTVEEKEAIEKGRPIVDEYRLAHSKTKDTYELGFLLAKLVIDLDGLKLNKEKEHSCDVFFDKSYLYNIEALGYDDKEDFDANATIADKEALEQMWK